MLAMTIIRLTENAMLLNRYTLQPANACPSKKVATPLPHVRTSSLIVNTRTYRPQYCVLSTTSALTYDILSALFCFVSSPSPRHSLSNRAYAISLRTFVGFNENYESLCDTCLSWLFGVPIIFILVSIAPRISTISPTF